MYPSTRLFSVFQLAIIFLVVFQGCKSNTEAKSCGTNVVNAIKNDLEVRGLPYLDNRVNDFENLFATEQKERLTSIIKKFEDKTTNQIVIVTTESIGYYEDFDRYALDLSNYNRVGLLEKNNGLTIVFSKCLRKARISTGYGTEKILTDEICYDVMDRIIIPEFQKGNFYQGTEKALLELITKWQ